MQQFTDALGREWKLYLDLDLHELIRRKLGVELTAVADFETGMLERLYTDFPLIVDILFLATADQHVAQGVVDDPPETPFGLTATRKFARGFAGDALEDASTALVDAVVDFFPNPEKRDALRKAVGLVKATADQATKSAMATLEAMDPKAIAKTMLEQSGNAFSKPSPSAESPTPGNTRSES